MLNEEQLVRSTSPEKKTKRLVVVHHLLVEQHRAVLRKAETTLACVTGMGSQRSVNFLQQPMRQPSQHLFGQRTTITEFKQS